MLNNSRGPVNRSQFLQSYQKQKLDNTAGKKDYISMVSASLPQIGSEDY